MMKKIKTFLIDLYMQEDFRLNKYFYLFILSTPIIIFQGCVICSIFYRVNYGINDLIIFFQAFIPAFISSYLLLIAILQIVRNKKTLTSFHYKNYKNHLLKVIVIYVLISIILVLTASRNGFMDYTAYLNHWAIINQGLDPWKGTSNAYLPIHNIFAPLVTINNSLPKILFIFIFLTPMYLSSIYSMNLKVDMDKVSKFKIFLMFAFSPFCILVTTYYGLNDTLVAGLMLFSLYLSISNSFRFKSLFSGISLAIATMVKVYPIFIAPLFIVRKRRIDLTFFISYLTSIISIFILSIIIWGKSTLNPILLAVERPSKHLSFFNFSRRILGINLDEYSIYAMGLTLIIVIFFIYKKKLDLLPAVILTLAIGFSFYKVGHPQFFLFFFGVSPMAIRYIYDKKLVNNRRLFISYLTWISFLNFYQTFYLLSCHMSFGFSNYLRGIGSLPYILFSTLMLFEFIKLFINNPKILSSNNSSA